jgi:hypothetical protein
MSGHCPAEVKKGGQMLVSLLIRLDAAEKKTTRWPSPLMAGSVLAESASVPTAVTLTRSVVCSWRSRTKMSGQSPGSGNDGPPPNSHVFVSSGTRLEAIESNAT